MTNKDQKIITELEKHANEFLKKEFNLTLEIPIEINGRLKRAAGRYRCKINQITGEITPEKIQIARFTIEDNKTEDVIDTLKHELVHYALSVKGEKFHDKDLNFINTCNRLGIGLTHNYKSKYKIFKCKKCGKITKSYTDISKKYFHKCGGALELIGMELLRASEEPTLTARTDEKPQKTTTKKLQNQKSKHTTELLKGLNLKELKLKHYPNLKIFMQGAYKEDGDVVTLYSYTTKIMDYNKKTGEARRYYGVTKETNAKIKELTRTGDLETLKNYKKQYWSYTTGMHIAEFSQQFMGEKLTKAKFEAIEHENDKQEPHIEEPEEKITPTAKEEPKLIASPAGQQIEMFSDDYVPLF